MSGCAHRIFKLLMKTKQKATKKKKKVGWSFTKVLCGCGPACLWTSLCTPGAWLCLQASLDAVPQKRKMSTTGRRWQDLAVTSSTVLAHVRNCYCRSSQGTTELNGGVLHLNVSTSHPLAKLPSSPRGVSSRLKKHRLWEEALPQAVFGLWAQGSQQNIFLAIVQGKKADI